MNQQPPQAYRGRFAPSPTGALHFGSVLAAIGSWLDARAAGGQWHLRFDDLDTPRNASGAEQRIVDELVRLELQWDGPVLRQSEHLPRYQQALAQLRDSGAAFACGCSRKNLLNGVYPGTCRDGLAAGFPERSTRLRVDDQIIAFDDLVQGHYEQNLHVETGDFVLLRADGIIGYHLATVLDDAHTGITHIVRGTDLLESTPRQIAIQHALELPTPHYAHLPIATNLSGQKLSKQTHAMATEQYAPNWLWSEALSFLGYPNAATMATASVDEIQDWALQDWALSRIGAASMPAPQQLLADV